MRKIGIVASNSTEMGEELITAHLNDILSNLRPVFGSVTSEIQIHR